MASIISGRPSTLACARRRTGGSTFGNPAPPHPGRPQTHPGFLRLTGSAPGRSTRRHLPLSRPHPAGNGLGVSPIQSHSTFPISTAPCSPSATTSTKPKALITAETVGQGHLRSVQNHYSGASKPERAGWIVAGTDDVEVRSEIQRLWPHRLVVTATESVFGYVAWHAPERADLPCAACEPTDGLQPEERIPTSAPTSSAAGVVAASTLLRLAQVENAPGRTDILTLRLDSAYALDASHPSPTPDSRTASGRRCGTAGLPLPRGGRGTPGMAAEWRDGGWEDGRQE